MSVKALKNAGQKIVFYHLVSRRTVVFPAFVTQFEDQFTSDWNEEYAFGRMDPISTFKRTGRKINLGWQIVAESEIEAVHNLGRISTLMKMLYPSYNSAEGQLPSATHIAGPPLMRVRFMNLIQNSANGEELLGYVGGFSTSPILDSGFIEISNGAIYPKAYEISCTFTVLHTHKVGWYGSAENRMFSDDPVNSRNYPYAATDPGFDELRERPSQPTETHEQDELLGGYSGVAVYEGDEDYVGGFSDFAEPPLSSIMSLPPGEDFPERSTSESTEENQAADQQQLLMSIQDDNLNMSGV